MQQKNELFWLQTLSHWPKAKVKTKKKSNIENLKIIITMKRNKKKKCTNIQTRATKLKKKKEEEQYIYHSNKIWHKYLYSKTALGKIFQNLQGENISQKIFKTTPNFTPLRNRDKDLDYQIDILDNRRRNENLSIFFLSFSVYFFFFYLSSSSSLCTVFYFISSKIDEVLSINPSAYVFFFG